MSTVLKLVEVCPRDGFQSVGPFIPTAAKIDVIRSLYTAGLRRMEVTSFVSPKAVPQLSDAEDVLAAARALAGLDAQVLTPSLRQAERAILAGADHIAFVLSASEAHNQSNVRRTPRESVSEYEAIAAMCPPGVKIRLNVATAFDCPYDGPVPIQVVLDLLESLVVAAPRAEIALCDTTGRVCPGSVADLFSRAMARFPMVRAWAFHGHDTFGMGAANCFAAFQAGVRVFDASAAGLGGCPFAPGATGNVATEDLVWMFNGAGAETGVDLPLLVDVAARIAELPGAQVGGRVREALRARKRHRAERDAFTG